MIPIPPYQQTQCGLAEIDKNLYAVGAVLVAKSYFLREDRAIDGCVLGANLSQSVCPEPTVSRGCIPIVWF